MSEPLISIVVAHNGGIPAPKVMARTREAYERETTGVELEFLFGPWTTAFTAGSYVHLTGSCMEPHPGWWLAAIAAVQAGYIPAPVLWRMDGTLAGLHEHEPIVDWATAPYSRAPFLSRAQLEQAGPPPSEGLWPDLPAVVRAEYAFTLHETPDR